MPTVHREGPYRFFFYSADRDEPPHIHVERNSNRAKFWLEPVGLHVAAGFAQPNFKQIERLVVVHEHVLLRTWNEYFTDAD